MRRDGSIVYYTILAKYIDSRSHWFVHVDAEDSLNWNSNTKESFGWHDPARLQYTNRHDDPTVSGFVWQRYGFYGVTNLKAAIRWFENVVPYHKWRVEKASKREGTKYLQRKYIRKYTCEFKIVRIRQTKKTEFISG